MEDIVIVSGARTAIGTLGGALSETPASDLGAHVIREVGRRIGDLLGFSHFPQRFDGLPDPRIGRCTHCNA